MASWVYASEVEAPSNSRLDFCQTGESGAVASSLRNFTPFNEGKSMRDVRDNLQRRANVLDQPSNATLAESGAPQTVAQTRRPAWLERAGTKLCRIMTCVTFVPTFTSVPNS